MKKYELKQNERGEYIVLIPRELGMVPILRTKRKSEAELMIKYLTEV